MMKQNGNTSEQSERGLLPYVVIVAATKGDPEAMKMVVQHYEGYISYLSTRTLKDEDERKSREALAKKYNLTSDGDNAASDADLDSSADSNLSEDSDSSEEAGSEPTEE